MAPNEEESIWELCRRIYDSDWHSFLPHLTLANADRHILLPLHLFEYTGFCSTAEPAWRALVESRRDSSELYGRMPVILTGPMHYNLLGEDGVRGAQARQRLLSMPLVSAVHLRATDVAPWLPQPRSRRPWLMSYGGSVEGQPRWKQLREHIVRKCREYGQETCRLVTAYRMEEGSTLRDALQSKRESVFCLEPPGFGEHRKSQVDALTLGCIPVMFVPRVDKKLWPLHWGPFRDDSRVLLDIDRVLSGDVDILQELRAISAARVQAMQRTIGQHANRMHYGLEDTPGDAVEVMLQHLDETATNGLSSKEWSFLRASDRLSCQDLWPLMYAGTAGHYHPLWNRLRDNWGQHTSAKTCPELMDMPDGASNARVRCDTAVPSRYRNVVFVRDLCMRTCGQCPSVHTTKLPWKPISRGDQHRVL